MGKSKRYILVYQSGHGDVWCNGITHIHMNGNCAGSAPLGVKEEGVTVEVYFSKCDCKFWSMWNVPVEVNIIAKGSKECIRGKKLSEKRPECRN